jgi:pimeloyl-ACP methyl ester carboxylesterase
MTDRLETIDLGDGRTLGYAQWGDLSGVPVFSLHGTPGSRMGRAPDEDAVKAAGLRVITYDPPGYGQSGRRPGRRVVDCVDDITAIADELGLDRFHVTGGSGGAPHALATAARLADRVIAVEAACARSPSTPLGSTGSRAWTRRTRHARCAAGTSTSVVP